MKACQQWISSDDDIDEEVETEMTLVFFYLSPILQNVPGAHWDFIFDVIENNLEVRFPVTAESCLQLSFLRQNSSFAESSTLTTLARTLRLIMTIQELAASNKSLRSVWAEREATILKSVRDLTAQKLGEIASHSHSHSLHITHSVSRLDSQVYAPFCVQRISDLNCPGSSGVAD